MTARSWHAGRWAMAALLLAAALLYLVTLDNGLRPGELAGGDLITHQYAQVQARPSNAPGYPLYTMGGWLWFHALRPLLGRVANPTAILSSYSTAWALLALALLYQLSLETTGNWLISLLTSAFYAVTYFFWYYAASTEQYTSAVAHTLAIVWLAFRWEEVEARHDQAATGYLLALAFLSGLTLAHLVTVAFIVPPLLWFVLSRRPDLLRQPRLISKALGLALLPLLSYAFVYVRGAQHPEWRGVGQWPSTWAWLLDFLSTRQGRDELTWSLQPLWTAEFPALIWRELTWIVLLGGLAGLVLLGRRRGLFLGSTLLIYLVFCFIDRLGNWYQVIMPAYALLVFSFTVAVNRLWQRLSDRSSRLSGATPAGRAAVPYQAQGTRQDLVDAAWLRPAAQAAVVVGLLLLIGLRFAWSLPQANQHDRPEDTALLPGLAILADEPATDAAVLGTYTETLSLRYLTDIWGRRPDVVVVDSATAGQLLATGERPLYVTEAAVPILWQEVSSEAHLSSAGRILIAVSRQPNQTLPASAQVVKLPAGDGLTLAAYEVLPATAEQDGSTWWRFRLYWQARSPISHDWSISLRLTRTGELLHRPDGSIVQHDLPHPVHGAYPTSRWSVGEVVADDYFVELPAGQAVDGIQVVVYRPTGDGFLNLAVLDLPLP